MALPTVNDLKGYLRIETSAEDTLLGALLARARAQVEVWLDVPITATNVVTIDRATAISGMVPTSLVCNQRPANVVSVTDTNGVAVTDYTVNAASGVIYASEGGSFPYGPYTIVASTGLSLRGDYARIEPALSQCILDLAADLYQKRTPNAASESAADTAIAWDVSRETAARVLKVLRAFKLPVAG